MQMNKKEFKRLLNSLCAFCTEGYKRGFNPLPSVRRELNYRNIYVPVEFCFEGDFAPSKYDSNDVEEHTLYIIWSQETQETRWSLVSPRMPWVRHTDYVTYKLSKLVAERWG